MLPVLGGAGAGPALERFLGTLAVRVSVRRERAAGPDLLLAQHQSRKQSD